MRIDTKIEEGVYLRKDWSGHRVIYPFKNEDGKPNWKNILIGGHWWNLVRTLIVVLLVLGMVWAYNRDIVVYKTIAEKCLGEPCYWCSQVMKATEGRLLPNLQDYINISELINQNGT